LFWGLYLSIKITFVVLDKKELQSEFLSNQIAHKILGEEANIEILKVAEKKNIIP
jgi:HTH-type transcriptional regulator, competence development regulator